MNIRLSSTAVRVRITKQEANELLEQEELAQLIPFPNEPMQLVVAVGHDLKDCLDFSFDRHCIATTIRTDALRELVCSPSDRKNALTLELGANGASPLMLIFQIDAFSQRGVGE